jgi:hypothetical protein
MRYISRSGHDTFRECPRKGYLRYLSGPFGGSDTLGLEQPTSHPALTLGIAWHMSAEQLLRGVPATEAVKPALEFAASQGLGDPELNWLLGICLAWERAVAEDFFAKYEVLSIEEELTTPLTSNVVLYTRADAILRDRSDGSLWVLNWKTAGDVKNWNRKWFYDIQSWTESLAAEAKLGEPVRGCIYLGVWKGPMYNGGISSRLIYGYKFTDRSGNVTYGTENNGSGTRFSVWNEKFPFGDGVAAWVSWLPKDFLKKYFVESAPQIRQDELVGDWLRQVVTYESDVDHVLQSEDPQDVKDFFFQNWSDQTCGRCAFNPICTLKATPEDLIAEGFLQPRKKSPRDEAQEKVAEE